MAKRITGLRLRGGIWHIEKRLRGGGWIRRSTGTGDKTEAVAQLHQLLREHERTRGAHRFAEAAARYLIESKHQKAISRMGHHLKVAMPFIGHLWLHEVHHDSIQPFIADRLARGASPSTVNVAIAAIRRTLRLAATLWRNPDGSPWLAQAPLLRQLPTPDARKPYPLSWQEQRLLLSELPAHLASMALFKLNTGTREQEVCQLRWSWEQQVPELGVSVFLLPSGLAKNGRERVIVLNGVARSVVEAQRGRHPERVFVFQGRPLTCMNSCAWKAARLRAAARYEAVLGVPAPWGFEHVRVHDLKHTCGARLRAAGVGLEDRADILGHHTGRITTHYSAPELGRLLEAVERITQEGRHTLLRAVS